MQTRFEQLVRECGQSGDFMPVWNTLLNMEFFVRVLRHDAGPQTSDFRFVVGEGSQGEPMVVVAEDLDRLQSDSAAQAIKVRGSNLVAMLAPGVGVLIALSEGGFGMPAGLVGWLRDSMQDA